MIIERVIVIRGKHWDVEVEFDYTVSGGTQGNYRGHPDKWFPDEEPDVEVQLLTFTIPGGKHFNYSYGVDSPLWDIMEEDLNEDEQLHNKIFAQIGE